VVKAYDGRDAANKATRILKKEYEVVKIISIKVASSLPEILTEEEE
jgi:hypothetical protein